MHDDAAAEATTTTTTSRSRVCMQHTSVLLLLLLLVVYTRGRCDSTPRYDTNTNDGVASVYVCRRTRERARYVAIQRRTEVTSRRQQQLALEQ